MRIACGGIGHETSTFATRPTTLDDFTDGFGLFRGDDIVTRFRSSNMCIGGFIDGAARHGFELVPLLWCFAYPSGVIPATDYAALKQELLDRLKAAGPIDGVLLDQHGAMVVEGEPDADGDLIAAVRTVVGPDIPIAVTFDLHGNHTERRVREANVVVGYDTYPHVDMGARGNEAADLLVEIVRGRAQPVAAFRKLPLFWSAPRQISGQPPFNELIDFVHEIEARPGILTATISTAFPWADIPNMGPSVMVFANGDRDLAERTADELANWIWDRRETWQAPLVTVTQGIERGEAAGKSPIVLADQGDNTGGGASGDSTEVLQTFLDRKLRDALVLYIVDEEIVALAHQVGVGGTFTADVGGKSHPLQGPPVRMTATVRGLSEGKFVYDGPMYAGLTGDMGPSAWIEQDGVHVIVVTAREQPLGPAFARTFGLDPAKLKYVAVKSAVHFRNSFEKIAGSIHNIDARGVHTHNMRALTYHHRPRPMYPLDTDE